MGGGMSEKPLAPGWYFVTDDTGQEELLRWTGDHWCGRSANWQDMARPTLPNGWKLGPAVNDIWHEYNLLISDRS
jgi:hypothetical protein